MVEVEVLAKKVNVIGIKPGEQINQTQKLKPNWLDKNKFKTELNSL